MCVGDRLKEVLGGIFDLSPAEIQDDTGPEKVGLWDSLNHLRMATEIERVFCIRLTGKEIRAMVTYSKIREIVRQHLQEPSC